MKRFGLELLVFTIAALAGLAAVDPGGVATKAVETVKDLFTPRGIRNNNPGNIRRNGISWLGLAPEQTDAAFYQFTDPVYGVRAMARILKNYRDIYSIRTIAGLVTRWAPPTENNTAAYIAQVAKAAGKDPDAVIAAHEWAEILPAVVAAMIHHENGIQPYQPSLIDQGIALA